MRFARRCNITQCIQGCIISAPPPYLTPWCIFTRNLTIDLTIEKLYLPLHLILIDAGRHWNYIPILLYMWLGMPLMSNLMWFQSYTFVWNPVISRNNRTITPWSYWKYIQDGNCGVKPFPIFQLGLSFWYCLSNRTLSLAWWSI